jgi:hypothetical protein
MDRLVITSTREDAGKTSIIVGIAKALGRQFGYMKPFGDRLLYRKKQLWDHDSALITNVFGLTDDPQAMSIGFDHAKLRYMYDEETTRARVVEAASQIESDKEMLLVESGKAITYGISVHLDAISLARYIGGRLLVVISGDEDTVLDDITFVKKYLDTAGVEFAGVIVNKLRDLENFENTYLAGVTAMGINVLGMIPYTAELTRFLVGDLAERLFARVIAGEDRLNNIVHNIFVGAMSVNAALRNPSFEKANNLMITSGDRTDMILATLESQTAGIILTNNILPPPNIISKVSERHIPLLLVSSDTYQVARQIDNLKPLLTKDDTEKIDLLERLAQEHVQVSQLWNQP